MQCALFFCALYTSQSYRLAHVAFDTALGSVCVPSRSWWFRHFFVSRKIVCLLAQSGVRFSLTVYAAVVAAIIESNSNTFSAKESANKFRCAWFLSFGF